VPRAAQSIGRTRHAQPCVEISGAPTGEAFVLLDQNGQLQVI
jgi:hypothetical protein